MNLITKNMKGTIGKMLITVTTVIYILFGLVGMNISQADELEATPSPTPTSIETPTPDPTPSAEASPSPTPVSVLDTVSPPIDGGCPGHWHYRDDIDGPNGPKHYCMAGAPVQNEGCPGFWQFRDDIDGPNGPKYYCMLDIPMQFQPCPGHWQYRDDIDGPNGPKYYCMAGAVVPTPTPTLTPTPTPTASPTVSPTPSPTPSPSVSPSPSPTPSPDVTPSPSPTISPSPSPTVSPSPSPTPGVFTVTCPDINRSARRDEGVTRRVEISGGTTPYVISWSGTDGLSGNETSISISYSSTGTKEATVTVTDAENRRIERSCNSIEIESSSSSRGGGSSGSRATRRSDVSLVQIAQPASLAAAPIYLSQIPSTGADSYPPLLLSVVGVTAFSFIISGFLFVRNSLRNNRREQTVR